MKKIIAISVMFALIAGAVFADTALSGAVEVRFSLAKQQGGKDDKPVMGGSIGAAQIRLSGSNTEGTLGGLFNFRNTDTVRDPASSVSLNQTKVKEFYINTGTATAPTYEKIEIFDKDGKALELDSNVSASLSNVSGTWFHRVFVWWKPIEQIKVFLGIDQDGMFDTAGIAGWSFHAGDNDYLFNHHWDFWRNVFPGNWDGFGLALSFYPMPGLDINLAIPTGQLGWPQARNSTVTQTPKLEDMLPGRLRLQIGYALDFGKINFVYNGAQGFNTLVLDGNYGRGWNKDNNNGQVALSVLVTAIEGLAIQAGGSMVLAKAVNNKTGKDINAGLAVAYTGDGFGVKLRGALRMRDDDGNFITGNIMPFFAVGEKGQVLVDIGVTQDASKKDPVKQLGWFVTPAYRLGIENGAFKIGLQVYNNIGIGGNINITGADFVRWNVPMLLAFNF